MRAFLFLLAALVLVPAASASTISSQSLSQSVEMAVMSTDAPMTFATCKAASVGVEYQAEALYSEAAQVPDPICYEFFIRIGEDGLPKEVEVKQVPCPEE